MKVATDRLVQGFVAAMGGDVEAPQRSPIPWSGTKSLGQGSPSCNMP